MIDSILVCLAVVAVLWLYATSPLLALLCCALCALVPLVVRR